MRRAPDRPSRDSSNDPCPTLAIAGALAALLLVCLGAVGCARKPADPVAALLAELEKAAEARDAERLALRLSADFRDMDEGDKNNATQLLKRTFSLYESVSIEVYGIETEREAGAARVRCIVTMSGRAKQLPGLEGLLPSSDAYRFALTVADEAGTWRVKSARWERAAPRDEAP